MSAPQFTPGPWKIFRASNGAMLGIGVDRPADEDHAMGVTDAYGGLWGSGGEKEANARLIAAAPELYEALKKCRDKFAEYVGIHGFKLDGSLSAIERQHVWEKINRNQEMVDLCEAALAKARGEQ